MKRTRLERTVLKVTNRCTLRCKLCQAFIPYYTNKYSLSFDDAKVILKAYFSIVDRVNSFTMTGGEPLLNRNLALIIREVYEYSSQIEKNIVIVTNGTLLMKDDVLDALEYVGGGSFVVISNYGPKLSKRVDDLVNSLEERCINYRVDDYCSDPKYGGWLDYRNHSMKHETAESKREQAKNCFWNQGEYFEINFGELHPCARSFWRMYSGIIPKNRNQYIDLRDSVSIRDKRRKLCQIKELPFLDSCAYCYGNKKGAKRYKPAEQLDKIDL